MKVAQINSVCGFSSTGRTTLDLAVQMQMQGISSRVYYGLRDTTYSDAVKFTNDLEVKLHVLKTRLLGKHAFYSKAATKRLVRMLKAYQPDALRLGQIHGHYLNVPILFDYLAQSNVPVVWTLHDCWAMTGHCAHFSAVQCEKWKTGCFECPQLHRYPKSLIFDRSKESWRDKKRYFQMPKNITLVCPSNWVAQRAKESFLNIHDIKTIYNGVNLAVFQNEEKNNFRQEHHINGDAFVLLGFAGKFFNDRNIKLAKNIIDRLPDDMCLVLVGATNKHQSLLNHKVIALPYINNISELAKVYDMADVLINLSHEDSFSKVTAEAIASGTPVIGFDATAIPEVIGDCGITLSVKAGANDFLDAVKRIRGWDNAATKKRCYARAQKYFDDKKNYQAYIDLIIKKAEKN